MQRVCFQLQVRPDRMEEYVERHAAVWPEMLERAARHRLAQLLAVPARRRPADRLRRDPTTSTPPRRRWPPPRSTPAGRPRWPSSSRSSTARHPTQGFLVARRGLPPGGPAASDPHHRRNRPERSDEHDDVHADRPAARAARPSRCPPGRSATPAPGSRCSARRARPRDRRGEDRRRRHRCTGSPGSRRRWPCTSRGTRSTTTPRCAPYAEDQGVGLGTINSNTFQDDDYKLGSLTHTDPTVRQKAIDHHLECIEVMDATGSRDLKIWLADGTNYPGQDDMRARQDRLAEALRTIYDRLGDDQRLVLEYKFFEPAFYHTDVPDWGTSYAHWPRSATGAMVCLDTGHHAPGTNIEFIVAQLLRLGKLGSFDFNSRFYADDDLIVGAADPFQLFRIMFEVVRGGGYGPDSERRVHARPVPQHRGEDPGPDPLGAQRAGDDGAGAAASTRDALGRGPGRPATCCGANEIFMDAFYTDVRADLAAWREERGPARRPDARPTSRAATRSRSRRTASAARRQDGPDDMTNARPWPSWSPGPTGWAPTREHQLRRRQHLRQGHRDRPGHRRARRAAVGQGLRRRPRHAHRGRPGGAAAGPDARAGRRLPRRRPRGRDGRRVRLLPARQGRRGAVDRHRDARPGRRRARRPPAPRLRASRSRPPPTARR